MQISFNRQTGMVTGLTPSLDNFTEKTISIQDISFIKFIEKNQLGESMQMINDVGLPLYDYNGVGTTMISSVIDVNKAQLIPNIPFDVYNYSITNNNTPLEFMKENKVVSISYNFPQNYTEFHIDNVMSYNFKSLLNSSDCEYIIASNFSDVSEIQVNISTYQSINKWEIILKPNDKIYLKSIKLMSPANIFRVLDLSPNITIHINNITISSSLQLDNPIDVINIELINQTDSTVILDKFAIGYLYQS